MRKKKILGVTLAATSMLAIGAIGLTTFNSSFVDVLFGSTKNVDNYSLTLNSSNKVSSAGDHVIYTQARGQVTFTYTNVSSYSDGHATIGNGGSIVNKSQITSLESITATYSGSGSLKARIAYVPGTWAEYFTVTSGKKVIFASMPYYIELKAEGGAVNLVSAYYTYSCESNPEAEPHGEQGSYDISFLKNNSDGTNELTTSFGGTFWEEVSDGEEYISSVSLSKVFYGKKGLKFASNSYEGSLELTFDSTQVVNAVTTVELATNQYGTKTSVFHVYVNDETSYTTITPSEGGSVTVNGELSSLTIETSGKQAYLEGLTINYDTYQDPDAPLNPTVYETGFSISDANKDKYTTNSVFDTDNALSVLSVRSDASAVPVTDYSYIVKDSSNNEIDTSKKFPAEGEYTLVVYYGNYIPQELTLYVGEYIYIADITASLTKTTFTTADTLSTYLNGGLTASITLSNGSSVSNISFSEFAANGLGLKLIRNDVSVDYTKPFGTTGLWKARVYSLDFESEVYYDIPLTVNSIPVQSVTLDQTSVALYVDGQVQLTASVYPTTATNDNVNWTVEDGSVASIVDNGDGSATVTALAVGGTTVTATAEDGSGVYGTCTITVSKQAVSVTDKLVREDTGVPDPGTGSVSYQSWSGVEKNSGAVYAGQSAGQHDTIQIRSKNSNSGIVTTTSGGKIAKVAVEWNENTTSGRVLNVYGKNSAYSDPTDLYNSSNYGILIGTITYGSTTELSISDEYTFVGVRSNDGAMFLDSISFIWGESTPATPVYPTSITLTGTSSISIGDTTQLTVGYSEGANVKNVTFASSNTAVAGVSNTGLVTGVAAGTATITATAEAANGGTVEATLAITVTEIAVTSVELNTASTSVKVGKTVTLIATVYPNNATNKNLKWATSSSATATVTNSGVVTGVAAGNATITAYSDTNNNNVVDSGEKSATCAVTVTASSGEEEFSVSYTDLPTTYQTGSTVYTAASGIKFQAYNCANYSSKMQFKASSGYLQTTEALELQSITINDRESNTLTVYGSNTAGSFSVEINGENDVYDLTGYNYFKVARTASGAGYCSSITVLTGTPTPTDPTQIILSNTSAEVGIGGSKQLTISYVPANANQNKEITWTSSNTNVATVNTSGLVSVKTTATAGQTATITAKLTNLSSVAAVTCKITVIEQQKDDHTVLLYICGADLESKNGLATGDIEEILKVSGQPDDVNIVIETGGASSWASTYGISSSKLERWHVENKSLVKDASLTYASMGLTSTFQSFLEYGLKNYPAERTGVILWNHGGGMHGVCYDEKKDDDTLLDNEVKTAVSGAMANCGLQGQKLEWIGYDACLMQVQDIAEMNSPYFNYMVASEESEAGYGWDYDNWVDDLYAKKTTPVILKAICDSFITDNGGVNSSSGDQTLSYLTLSYAAAYKTAWENMAAQLQGKLTSSNKSTFNNAIVKNVKHFADSDYDYFCLFDAKDFINKLASGSAFSSFRIDSSYTTAVLNAHANLVTYSTAQKGAGNAFGLCMYWCNSSSYSDMSVYTTSHTNFTTWRSINDTYGTHI